MEFFEYMTVFPISGKVSDQTRLVISCDTKELDHAEIMCVEQSVQLKQKILQNPRIKASCVLSVYDSLWKTAVTLLFTICTPQFVRGGVADFVGVVRW